MNLPLNLRVILLVFLSIGTLIGGILITVYQLAINNHEQMVTDRTMAELNSLAIELELTQQQRVLGLEAFAARLLDESGELRPIEHMQSLLQQPSVASDLFPDGLLVFDANSTAIAESQYAPNRLGTNYADRPHFRLAAESRSSVISEPILGRVTGLPLISYLQPLLSREGEIIAYAGGILDLANTPLLREDNRTDSDIDRTTLIIDPHHRLFVSMREKFDKPEPLPEAGVDSLVDAALALVPSGSKVEYQDQQYLVATRQLSSPDWIVLHASPYTEVIGPARESYQQFILIAFVLSVVITAMGAWIARNLTKPIERMTRHIEAMADAGEIQNDFQEVGGPEVQALARAMNRLAIRQNSAYQATRKAERFLTNVLNSASELAIIATDKEGTITAFNKGAEAMLGYAESEMVGKQSPAILHLDSEIEQRSAELSAESGRLIEGFNVFVEKPEQSGSEKREWTYVHKNGHQIPVSLTVTPLKDELNEVTGYLGLAEDITERKRLDKMKSEFISTISHELRTPLTSISGALGLLLSGRLGELPAKAQKLLETAERNSKRLTHLINDLLDIEKIANGHFDFDMQVQPLQPLIVQAAESNREYGSDRGIKLSISGEVPEAKVRVDSDRLLQVLANLISNAIKFSPDQGSVVLNVETSRGMAVISVIDKGPGIAESFRNRIFQRFAQSDSSDTRSKGGTGLGLAISRELVEKMGGRIDFESVEGQGSRFFVELPLVNALADDVKSDLPTIERASPRILVVEDDPDVAHLIEKILTDAGYRVESVHNGTDALHRLKDTHYDLLCLDLMLPDVSGLDIIRRLREQPKTVDLPIMVVSAIVEEGRLAFEDDLSHIDWLAKPIDQQRLLTLVRKSTSAERDHQPHVLHVEDDADLHEVVATMLEGKIDFSLAKTLEEAQKILEQSRFDVVLLDLGLPDGSGWDLLPDIRARQPDARVIVLSGQDLTSHQQQRIEGALVKTRISIDELLNMIDLRLVESQGHKTRA